jgi:hydroxymethylpyrimidine/phosphomethylpyrimidine kinase
MAPEAPQGRVLVIAGSDSGGGAGIQADIKTVMALGGYAATAVTAITVQNTLGVKAVHVLPAELVRAQAAAVLEDIGADAIKTGMLAEAAIVEAVALVIDEAAGVPAVIDPVMAAKGGRALLSPDAVQALTALLIPRAALLTPNAEEARILTGQEVAGLDDQRRVGDRLLAMGAKAALMKGGHVAGERVTDVLVTPRGERLFEGPRQAHRHTHGSGCTLASACAAGLAQGMELEDAVARAIAYTAEAIAHPLDLGAGQGPFDHAWPLKRGPAGRASPPRLAPSPRGGRRT